MNASPLLRTALVCAALLGAGGARAAPASPPASPPASQPVAAAAGVGPGGELLGRRWVWLPGTPRALPFTLSASRDAPVLEYAYGPRAQLSLGHDLGVVERRGAVTFHLSVAALAALENSRGHGPLPLEVGRLRAGLAASWSFDGFARRRLGPAGVLEVGLGLGVERARALVASETDRPVPAARPGDIPFGGGGNWLAVDAAVRLALRPRWTLSLRVVERIFWSAWPLVGGARAASDVVADFTGDGLAHAPSLDVTLAWTPRPWLRPLLSAFAEGLFPQDQSADASYFVRGLLGVGFRGAAGETIPFVSFDAGSGKGLLVNRHEARFSAGVRHAF
jgi:hypothetical protein